MTPDRRKEGVEIHLAHGECQVGEVIAEQLAAHHRVEPVGVAHEAGRENVEVELAGRHPSVDPQSGAVESGDLNPGFCRLVQDLAYNGNKLIRFDRHDVDSISNIVVSEVRGVVQAVLAAPSGKCRIR